MRYRLSRLIPVRFRTLCGVQIAEAEIASGGHGNHYRGDEHYDAESCTWWQWRDRTYRPRTMRICLPTT